MGNEVIATPSLRTQAHDAFRGYLLHGWTLARVIAQIDTTEAFLGWTNADGQPFPSLHAWAHHDFPAWFAGATLYHYRAVGHWIESLPAPEAQEWEKVPISNVIVARKALADPEDRREILGQLQAGATQSQIRRFISGQQPDQHEETEWRTIMLKHVSLAHYEQWQQAVRAIQHVTKTEDLPDDALVLAFARSVLGEMPPEWDAIDITDGPTAVPETDRAQEG